MVLRKSLYQRTKPGVQERIDSTGIRIFDGVFPVDGPLAGELKDWPANIQDPIYKAIEELSFVTQLRLALIASRCDIDHGETEAQDQWYIHVIISEVVVGHADLLHKQKAAAALRESITGPGRTLH